MTKGGAKYARHLVVQAKLEGRNIRVMIDSGATGNFISKKWLQNQGLKVKTKKDSYALTLADGTPLRQGRIDQEVGPVTLGIMDHEESITLDVADIKYDAILGIPWLETHNPVVNWKTRNMGFPNCQCEATGTWKPEGTLWARPRRQEIAELKESISLKEYSRFQQLFVEDKTSTALPQHQPWDHTIPLKEGKEPKYGPIYQLSEKELKELRNYLDENLKKGFIRPSTSPAGYPILFARKKDGSLRLCVDYRQLNAITIKNRYALPLIAELQDRIKGAKWFTKIDLRAAYNLIRMKKGEEWKTAFRTRYGHYEYLVMPFGLTNAPASCQALVNDALREYLDIFTVAYLDDILVYSKSYEEHVQHVTKVLSALEKHGLRVNLEKCEFHKQRVEFLGSIITTKGVLMDPKKVEAVQTWPQPKTVKELQSFLGFANFYRRFIEGYSKTTAPLTELTKKEGTFTWGMTQQNAFEDLKKKFISAPILATFDPERQIILETDASDLAIGMCISQPDDEGRSRPIAFYSRKMIPAELNYEIHDKELLAIVTAFNEWRAYLEGPKYPVKVYTDHKNLLYFTTTKALTRRQVRWAETLAAHNFEILYTKGKENAKADALSRRPDHMGKGTVTAQAILKMRDPQTIVYNRHVVAAMLTIETDEISKRLIRAYSKDKVAKEVKKHPERMKELKQTDSGLILFKGLVYVPTRERNEIIRMFHEETHQGHQGIDKTIEKIGRTYYFPGMNRTVRTWIGNCDVCRKTKHERHKPYGEMASRPGPSGPWRSIAMDFIVKLPESKEKVTRATFDSILVITDRLTKYAMFIPYKEASDATDLAYTFLRRVVADHGMPEEITSDRDKLFTSKFWKSLVNQLGTRQKMSTAFHPQTDGQTERLNQTLEQYLRAYVNYGQNDWVEHLPMAQFAYNNSVSTLGETPFYANKGYHPEIFREKIVNEGTSEAAKTKVEELGKLHDQLRKDMDFKTLQSKTQFDKHRTKGPVLRKGDPVYLLRKNIKTKRPSTKLDFTKLGPFEIEEVLGGLTYRLKLPSFMRIHPVFHISLLEPAPASAKTAQIETEPDNEYEVEKVLRHWRTGRITKYLIKWSGYGSSENSWEPETNLSPVALARYWGTSVPKKRTKQPVAAHQERPRQNLSVLEQIPPPGQSDPRNEHRAQPSSPEPFQETRCGGRDFLPLGGQRSASSSNEPSPGPDYRNRPRKSCHRTDKPCECTQNTSAKTEKRHTGCQQRHKKNKASPQQLPATTPAPREHDETRSFGKVCRHESLALWKKKKLEILRKEQEELFSLWDQASGEGDSVTTRDTGQRISSTGLLLRGVLDDYEARALAATTAPRQGRLRGGLQSAKGDPAKTLLSEARGEQG
jgi:RNase H-like domain found in reverse transcriptase/Reverse transcriptase (RNA-dependent DNA polymerase)/Integrase zinc binding domain/Chromo (CHRromatin Organisation MOdifier) domain/Aspartyl protease